MSSFPDRRRLKITPRARALAAPLFDLALSAMWRILHPDERTPFVESPRPPAVRRLYYTASDGWSAPLRVLEPRPGGAGEPVILAHSLGLSAESYRYGQHTLAQTLQRAGFRVYVFAHRGDRDSIAPDGPTNFDVDDIVARDVEAALQAVREDSGYRRAFWLGHGLGGQLGVILAATGGDTDVAGLVCLNTAVRFVTPTSEVRRLLQASRWLPRGWVLPGRVAALAAPLVADGPVLERFSGQGTDGACVRGVLRHAAGNVPVSLLQQVSRWVDAGVLSDRTGHVDYLHALGRTCAPLLVVHSAGDDLCRPAQARPLLAAWGASDTQELALPEAYGHDDVLFGRTAEADVHAPIADWLHARRKHAWRDA